MDEDAGDAYLPLMVWYGIEPAVPGDLGGPHRNSSPEMSRRGLVGITPGQFRAPARIA